jgi:hypothetical protein
MMPRRKSTREHDRTKRIEAERARNQKIRENPESPRLVDRVVGVAYEDPYFHHDHCHQTARTPPPF